jgi:anti-sigma regulatory factor (Ser/Thr protein kinase)
MPGPWDYGHPGIAAWTLGGRVVEGTAPTAQDTDELRLAADAGAPRAARDFAARACLRWETPDWTEPAELIVSELVTNAVQHAGTHLTVRLTRTAAGLVVAVEDESGGDPRVVPAARRGAGGGLGLAIVERLAQSWGVTERGTGKTVWAVVGGEGSGRDVAAGGGAGDEAARGASARDAAARSETARDENVARTVTDRDRIAARDVAGTEDCPGQSVALELPWDKDLVVIARSAAAHAGVRAGFSRQEVEDLRLAVDEACALVLGVPGVDPDQAVLRCRLVIADGAVRFAVTAAVEQPAPAPADGFGWHLLGALVDEIAWLAEPGSVGVRAEKRAEARR